MVKQREHWGSHLGFILAAAGSAIGLGTLWKFPYVTGDNGGGLFFLIYALFTFIIGLPIFMAELVLGRRAQRGAVGTFKTLSNDSPIWIIPGWFGVISAFFIMSFYSVLAGWGLNYVFMSLNQFWIGKSAIEISQVFTTLEQSGDITIMWHLVFMTITAGVIYRGVRQGIEYWSKIMTTALFVILIALSLYTMTLDGFGAAVKFIFYPNFSEFKPSSLLDALGLAFFTLSLGQGVMLTYGSYMRPDEDIPKTAGVIGIMIIVAAIISSMVIFPIIFTFGFAPQEGPGLVFKTLPILFAKLPGSLIISTTFFILFVFTALTSAVALVEVVVANFMDLLGWSRRRSVLVASISCFVFGIPSALSGTGTLFANWPEIYGKSYMRTIDDTVTWWLLPIGGLMVSIYSGWVLDKEIIKEEFQKGTTAEWLWYPWIFFLRWVAPAAIMCIILQQAGIINVDTLFLK